MRIKNLLYWLYCLLHPKYVRLISVFLFALFGLVNANAQSMNVLHIDQSETILPVDEIEAIVFSRNIYPEVIEDFMIKQINHPLHSFHSPDIMRITFSNATNISKNSIENQRNISFFPNPVDDILNINALGGTFYMNQVEIVSSAGSVVYKKVLNPTRDRVQINLSSLSPGLYFGKIQMGTTIETIKFFKK